MNRSKAIQIMSVLTKENFEDTVENMPFWGLYNILENCVFSGVFIDEKIDEKFLADAMAEALDGPCHYSKEERLQFVKDHKSFQKLEDLMKKNGLHL